MTLSLFLAGCVVSAPHGDLDTGPAPLDTSPTSGSGTQPTESPIDTDIEAEDTDTAAFDTGTDVAGPAPDYSQPGPYEVYEESDSFAASCTLSYTTFVPLGASPETLVVLSHGFARNRSVMREWAEHYASWGLAVVTPNLCHLSLLDVDQEANGVDLASLAEGLAPGQPVLYMGHSAGGVASTMAALEDSDAQAVFGLDLTQSSDEGSVAARSLGVGMWGLFADPERCNTDNNGLEVLEAAPISRGLHLLGADHCDFENPTDLVCTLACAEGSRSSDSIRQTIFGLSTAWLVWESGVDPQGETWWTPGGYHYDELLRMGAFEEVDSSP